MEHPDSLKKISRKISFEILHEIMQSVDDDEQYTLVLMLDIILKDSKIISPALWSRLYRKANKDHLTEMRYLSHCGHLNFPVCAWGEIDCVED